MRHILKKVDDMDVKFNNIDEVDIKFLELTDRLDSQDIEVRTIKMNSNIVTS